MLGGTYNHNIDQKNRLFMPAKLRDELGESFVITESLRGKSLKVFSKSAWDAYLEPIRKLPRALQEEALRDLNQNSSDGTPDSQGRIILTPEQIAFAEIEKNTVIIGCGEYVEIWSQANYEKMQAETDRDAIRRQLEALGL